MVFFGILKCSKSKSYYNIKVVDHIILYIVTNLIFLDKWFVYSKHVNYGWCCCLVVSLLFWEKKMIDAIEVIYVLFLGVCMSTFCEMMMLEHMVHLCIVLSSCSCIVISRQVNIAVVCYILTSYLFYLHFIKTLTWSRRYTYYEFTYLIK